MERQEAWLQVSAGHGPGECAWAVLKVAERMQNDAAAAGIEIRTLDVEPGPKPGTAQSVLFSVAGEEGLSRFVGAWRGTVQWIAQSPFRPEHKRKNWFVGVEVLEPPSAAQFDPRDVRFETMRASGPGGQHLNRTESAVRVTHVPTGLQASASEERSQHRNTALAVARLSRKLEGLKDQQRSAAERAAISKVRGVRLYGVRIGSWLTSAGARQLLGIPKFGSLRGKRDRALLAVLLGCGLRRDETASVSVTQFRIVEDRWVIADLIGKLGRIRTVVVPHWAKAAVDQWVPSRLHPGGATVSTNHKGRRN